MCRLTIASLIFYISRQNQHSKNSTKKLEKFHNLFPSNHLGLPQHPFQITLSGNPFFPHPKRKFLNTYEI